MPGMMQRRFAYATAVAATVATMVAAPTPARSQAVATKPDVDAVFARYTRATPGCAVGVAGSGIPTLTKGYGSADLEHDVPITAETVFEAGSVSKQFTAAAVLLLARDGKLSIDDPVKKYIPELPDYGKPLLIRHMLNHTSGLRDWGSVAAIGGWPRTTRVHTHDHVLEIVSRQEALNFAPGANWSYSNTGFNLAAIIVARVSGMPFADFTRERIFKPAGMTHTSWRDDYTRIVKNRAIAYEEDRAHRGEFKTDMPFENVHGNGGLLTTVGDLLKWNENFTKPAVGDAAFVEMEQQAGKFNDGRTHGYAFGLFVGKRGGLREVYHSGSTAGYSAFLTRFPDQKLSVAVLCNVATNATTLAHNVSDAYLGIRMPPTPRPLSDAELDTHHGMYRSLTTGRPLIVGRDSEGQLRGSTWTFDAKGATSTDEFGTIEKFAKVAEAHPSAADLAVYQGVYTSREAEVELRAVVENGRLVLKRRPATTITLTPLYADAFNAPGLGLVLFHRNAAKRPVELTISQDRVWAMVFPRKSTS